MSIEDPKLTREVPTMSDLDPRSERWVGAYDGVRRKNKICGAFVQEAWDFTFGAVQHGDWIVSHFIDQHYLRGFHRFHSHANGDWFYFVDAAQLRPVLAHADVCAAVAHRAVLGLYQATEAVLVANPDGPNK